jgi:hypothetical protein
MSNDQGLSVPGLLVPSLLPDRDVTVKTAFPLPFDDTILIPSLQPLEREPMVDDMPRTELVLALYMAKQLVRGNQDFISSSYARERCVIPMGFFEQVELVWDC